MTINDVVGRLSLCLLTGLLEYWPTNMAQIVSAYFK